MASSCQVSINSITFTLLKINILPARVYWMIQKKHNKDARKRGDPKDKSIYDVQHESVKWKTVSFYLQQKSVWHVIQDAAW